MDAIAALLDGPRASGAFALEVTMSPPWALRVQDHAPLTVVAVVEGSVWLVPDADEACELGVGDVAIVRGPDPYLMADEADRPPTAIVHPDQRCETVDGRPLAQALRHGVRTWGNDADGRDVMLVGTYESVGEVSGHLLAALPPVAVVRADEWDTPLLDVLRAEITRDAPGQGAVVDRLVDVVVVAALRAWFDRPGAPAPAWYRSQSDPVVGPALELLHHHPEQPWTLAALAGEVGVSRATLARSFAEALGQPPMTYLTEWRLGLAADKLREPGATVTSVARDVGYSTPYAFSAAFKRVRGVSPSEHRAAVGAR